VSASARGWVNNDVGPADRSACPPGLGS
jgi:hypothetical protein